MSTIKSLTRIKRRLLFIALLLLANGLQAGEPEKEETVLEGKAIKIADGDTITLLQKNGDKTRIRLSDIDAPEGSQQPYGKKAKAYLASMVGNKTVVVKVKTTDRYGRAVGRIFVKKPNSEDWLDVNREMIVVGLAWFYSQYSQDQDLKALQQAAKTARKGMWQQKRPEPPWEYRQRKKKH